MRTTWYAHLVDEVALVNEPAALPEYAGAATTASSPPNFCQGARPNSKPPLAMLPTGTSAAC
jgi:hypothetical protein